MWADPGPDGGPPNNWLSTFPATGAAWTLDAASGQYYLHSYTAAQPDLNWHHLEVRVAMADVLRFVVALNFGDQPAVIDLPDAAGGQILLSTDPHRATGEPADPLILTATEGVLISATTAEGSTP